MYDLNFISQDSGLASDAANSETAAAVADDAGLLDAYSNAVVGAVDKVGPAVVHIKVEHPVAGKPSPALGSGSGVIVAPDGLVLTNSHVVHGATRVEVSTGDGRTMAGRVLGDDPDTDLALVGIDAAVKLPSARLGDSQRLKAGQLAIAIGNPATLTFHVFTNILLDANLSVYLDDFIGTIHGANPSPSETKVYDIDAKNIQVSAGAINGGSVRVKVYGRSN